MDRRARTGLARAGYFGGGEGATLDRRWLGYDEPVDHLHWRSLLDLLQQPIICVAFEGSNERRRCGQQPAPVRYLIDRYGRAGGRDRPRGSSTSRPLVRRPRSATTGAQDQLADHRGVRRHPPGRCRRRPAGCRHRAAAPLADVLRRAHRPGPGGRLPAGGVARRPGGRGAAQPARAGRGHGERPGSPGRVSACSRRATRGPPACGRALGGVPRVGAAGGVAVGSGALRTPAPSPKAALALMNGRPRCWACGCPPPDLEIAAAAYERQVSELVQEDEEDVRLRDGPRGAPARRRRSGRPARSLVEEVERYLREFPERLYPARRPGLGLFPGAGQPQRDLVVVAAGDDLEADGEAVGGEPRGHRHRRVPAQVGQHGERRGQGAGAASPPRSPGGGPSAAKRAPPSSA